MTTKPDGNQNIEEERLAHALVSRGLLTAEEARSCRSGNNTAPSAEAFLQRLVTAQYLTAKQAQRALQELPLLLKQHIPGYQLLEKLGQGAMGTVFKARQLSMNRLVAVKVLSAKKAADARFLERLIQEARLAAKLSHNNIVQAIDVGSAGPIHYFVMEYIEGTTIQKELGEGKTYEEQEAVDIIIQIAQALQHAHSRGLVHRDIKPANIILTPDRIAKLADLGIARESGAPPPLPSPSAEGATKEKGMTVGTPFYISPEQILAKEDIDSRADIYSLGATFYHMVTGQPPFTGKVNAVLKAHLEKELTPPDHINQKLSSGLGEVVEFMMAKDRNQRYKTPEDLILDLERILVGKPPKLARERIAAATLEELSQGETDEEAEERTTDSVPSKKIFLWIGVLAGLLALSALLNLVQFLRH